MSKVNHYLFSNFLNTFISLFVTLFLIMSIVFFIQIARITSYIEIDFIELGKLYSYTVPQILLFTVPISFFVSVAMSFFRLSKENESIVIFTLGQDPKKIARFFISISAILSALLLINSLIAMPYVKNLNDNFIDYKKSKINLNIKPNEFGQSFGNWMIFVGEKDEKNNIYRDITMFYDDEKNEKFISANSGHLQNHNSNLEFILKNGKIYNIEQNRWNIGEFDTLSIQSTLKSQENNLFSVLNYWSGVFKNKKIAKKFTIYVLLSLFPLASILFALSFGIVTYRYEKGIIYFGIFGVLSVYFSLIMIFSKHHFYAVLSIFLLSFICSNLFFKKKILAKY